MMDYPQDLLEKTNVLPAFLKLKIINYFSVMPCLAHGRPTLANLEFKYFDSMPIDARVSWFIHSNLDSYL